MHIILWCVEQVGGKWFTIVYALLGIPLVLTAVGICAAEVLYFFEVIAVMKMDELNTAFDYYDKDKSGAPEGHLPVSLIAAYKPMPIRSARAAQESWT
jgi:hypothetical protein